MARSRKVGGEACVGMGAPVGERLGRGADRSRSAQLGDLAARPKRRHVPPLRIAEGRAAMKYGQVEGTEIRVLDPRFKRLFAGYARVERL